jgi:serine/threonine-protein phosphatase 2A regulatory subunit B'
LGLETNLQVLFDMLAINLFRTPKVQVMNSPGALGVEVYDPKNEVDEEEVMLEESWSHVQLAYEILVRVLMSPSISDRQIKLHINDSFIGRLFQLMKSPDPRERDYLKTIIHRIYSKYQSHRRLVRKLMI